MIKFRSAFFSKWIAASRSSNLSKLIFISNNLFSNSSSFVSTGSSAGVSSASSVGTSITGITESAGDSFFYNDSTSSFACDIFFTSS